MVTKMNRLVTHPAATFLIALLIAVPSVAVAGDSLAVVAPIPRPGPYPVACSNVAQDFSRLAALEMASEYWRGLPRGDGSPRYVTDLLSEPEGSLPYAYTAPSDSELFGRYAGRAITDVALVCYPTTAENTRPDYPLPNGESVPHMQRGTDAPILPFGGRLPVILFSHGYAGSPLEIEYFRAQLTLASFGYVTVAPFHGDLRWSLLGFEGIFEDGLPSGTLWRDFVALQALRPVSASAMLDALSAHAQWKDAIDLSRIGGFGISQGGETMMLLAGAAVTTTVFQGSKRVTHDTRLAAAVGYVPYFGLSFLPAFGRDSQGIDGVSLPFLAIGGTDDDLAPIERIEQGVRRLGGTRSLVAITGLRHDLAPAYPDDIFTWAITFIDAQMGGDPAALAKLQRMASVAGGAEDIRRIDYTAPGAASGDERLVVEYFHEAFGHYFVTEEAAEQAALDAGSPPGWKRTGLAFKAVHANAAAGLPNCRFFGVFGNVSTHFFTNNGDECAESDGPGRRGCSRATRFARTPRSATIVLPIACGSQRLYNNSMGGAINHRYTTSASEAEALAGNGWVDRRRGVLHATLIRSCAHSTRRFKQR